MLARVEIDNEAKKKLTLNAMLINAGLVLIAVLNRVLRPTVIPCLPPQTTLTALTIPVTNVIIARVYTHHRNYR